MTTTFDICEYLAGKVQADAAVIAFCNTNFSKQPDFFIGFDTRKPPASDQIPFIMMVPNALTDADDHREHGVLCAVVCTDDTQTTAAKITKYNGFDIIEQFETLVYNAIVAALIPVYDEDPAEDQQTFTLLSSSQARLDQYYPEYHATRELTITSSEA